MGSAWRLAGSASVHCDWGREQVWSATSISECQQIQLYTIHLWDALYQYKYNTAGQESKFDQQLLSQSSSRYNCIQSISEMHTTSISTIRLGKRANLISNFYLRVPADTTIRSISEMHTISVSTRMLGKIGLIVNFYLRVPADTTVYNPSPRCTLPTAGTLSNQENKYTKSTGADNSSMGRWDHTL